MKQLTSLVPLRLMVFIFVLFANSSYAPVKRTGFYCDDESIKYPFTGDSINFILLLAILLGAFPILIYATELLIKKNKTEDESPKFRLRLLLRYYSSGFLFVLGFTEVLKLTFCELRPHFISTCMPDMENIKCSDGYITNYNCTGKGPEYLLGRDSFKSFPSGHASLSVYSFVFLNIYLCLRLKKAKLTQILWRWSRSILVTTFMWTVVCCISRMVDNRHFWWDVLVGMWIGIFGGLLSLRIALKATLQRPSIQSER